jgi:hypothetical protein
LPDAEKLSLEDVVRVLANNKVSPGFYPFRFQLISHVLLLLCLFAGVSFVIVNCGSWRAFDTSESVFVCSFFCF